MISNNKKDNFAVSPLSATMCMSMLANSTSDDTQAAIIRMLGCENLNALNDYNKRLLEYLPVYNDIMKLSLVNNIWFANRYAGLSPDFVSNMNKIFKASISVVDFSKSSTLDIINKWSNDNTFGMIPTIAESLNPATKMMLANALYFKSNWHDKFNPSMTKPEIFNGVNGAVTTDMMHIVENVGYVESDGIKMMNKQFAESHAEIYFLLPREGDDIMDFASKFTYSEFKRLQRKMGAYEVTLSLPKFKSSANLVLNDIFEGMGVNTMGMSIAPTGLTGEKVDAYISHFTAIEVNEVGAEAAAVTVTDMYPSAPTKPAEFVADRPFIYFIIEHKT